MKIEKINDNQIRCTLTKEDLLSREIKLSELAYGTEKAKSLFRDMMQQAAYEFGFEANDIPLVNRGNPSFLRFHHTHHHEGGGSRKSWIPVLPSFLPSSGRYALWQLPHRFQAGRRR